MKFIKKIILLLNIVLVVGLILAYLSPYFDPNSYWVFSMFGLFYPVLLLANIVAVIFWLLVDFKYLFLSLFTILLGWSHLQGFVNFSALSTNTGDLKIMTYNVKFGYEVRNGTKKQKKAKKAKLSSFYASQGDVDLFCLQECSTFTRDILKNLFPDYHAHEIPKRGTFIYSKFPVLNHGEINFGTSTNSCLWTELKLPNDTIRVYNMHLQSNQVSKDAVKVIDNVNLQEKKTWTGIKGILSKYSATSRKRAKQAQMISAHVAKSKHKTIICGDLNDPPTSYTYSRLCGDFQDSFVEAGAGIGTTYGGRLPMLRIDYIFVDDEFEVESFKVLKDKFSDHFPSVGVYSIK